MFKALLRMPTGAAGEKAAADPQRRVAIASFMVRVCPMNYLWIQMMLTLKSEVSGSPAPSKQLVLRFSPHK
jgi:hypothetical protein